MCQADDVQGGEGSSPSALQTGDGGDASKSAVLAIALAKRQAIISELAKIDQFLDLHTQLFGNAQNLRNPIRKKKRGNGAAITDEIERVLRNAERPLNRREIRDAIEATGFQIPAADKSKYVTIMLWRRRDKFKSVDGGYILMGCDRIVQDEEARSADTATAEERDGSLTQKGTDA